MATGLPLPEPAFTPIEIDGTVFSASLNPDNTSLDFLVEGPEAVKRGRATLNMIGDVLRADLGYHATIKYRPLARKLEAKVTLSSLDLSDPVNPDNVAFEVEDQLKRLKALAEKRGEHTNEPIGFDIALKALQRVDTVTLTHDPEDKAKPYLLKQALNAEGLREAVNLGLYEAEIDRDLPDGPRALELMSGAIIDAVSAAQRAKPPVGKWTAHEQLTTEEVANAMVVGIRNGLTLAKAPKDKFENMVIAATREIFQAVRDSNQHGYE